MKRSATVSVLLLFMSLPLHSSENRRDGNWWREQSTVSKLSYVTGFFDGMDLGSRFSYWSFVHGEDGKCVGKAIDSYNSLSDKFLNNVTNGQLVDGLDNFYADYRNRRIKVVDAVWLVANGIAGTPQKQLEEMIKSWRKNSAD